MKESGVHTMSSVRHHVLTGYGKDQKIICKSVISDWNQRLIVVSNHVAKSYATNDQRCSSDSVLRMAM